MRKQYRYSDSSFGKKTLYIYHDGMLVEIKELYIDDFLDAEEELKSNGYTYGYTEAEVEVAKNRYNRMLANMIEV